MRALLMVLALSGPALADATVPAAKKDITAKSDARGTLRGNEPFVIEGERAVSLQTTSDEPVETPVLDAIGFVDATLSAGEPRGGLTVIKRPTAKLKLRRTK
jgi:hypothetical protein